MMIIVFVRCFAPWFLLSLWIFVHCESYILSVLLFSSATVLAGNSSGCWRLGNWEGRLEKIIFICGGWSQRKKGEQNRFPVTELGMQFQHCISGAVGKVCTFLQPTCCPGRTCPWAIRECPLEFGFGKTLTTGQNEARREWSVGFTDVRKGKKRLQLVFCCRTRGETGGLSLGEKRERGEDLWVFYYLASHIFYFLRL